MILQWPHERVVGLDLSLQSKPTAYTCVFYNCISAVQGDSITPQYNTYLTKVGMLACSTGTLQPAEWSFPLLLKTF